MAEPNAPFSITPLAAVEMTVSAAKRTVTLTTLTQLLAYLAGSSFGGVQYGDDVSLALGDYDANVYGDELLLPVPGGVQTGNDYVTFRSVNLSVLPAAGVTVQRSDTANMPRLITKNGARGFFKIADGVDHYRFQGIRVYGNATTGGGLFLQSPSSNTSVASHPHHVTIDRCIMDFDPTTGAPSSSNAIQMTGRHMAVINSGIYDMYSTGGEPHGILMPGGQGPYLIHQNELQVVGSSVFSGDNQLANPGIVPSDITVTENYIHVPVEHNTMGFLYNTGTAALNATGNVVTLSGGTVDPAWNDGSTYWIPTGPRNGNGFYKPSVKIVGVNVSGDPANSIRLNASWPDDGTRNTVGLLYHVTKWDGRATGYHKNLWEAKHAQRVKISGNVFARSYMGSQANCIALISNRGEDAACSDVLFENNIIIDCAIALTLTSRPGDGTGQGWNVVTIDGAQGGLVTIHATGNIDIANHNGNCEIRGCSVSEANGIWPATYIDRTTFTIPVTFVGPYNAAQPGAVTMYKGATPAVRVAIKNNVILNPGSPQAMLTDSFPNQNAYNIIGINTYPILVATGGTLYNGGNDGALSTTGGWGVDDFNCEHNTIVGPYPGAVIQHSFGAIEYNNNTTATDWKGQRFTFRNNIVRGGTVNYAVNYAPGSTNVGAPTFGTAALDKFTDTARNFLHNIIFSPWDVGSELAVFSGTDDDKLAMLADPTSIGFTSYAGSSQADLANFILQNLYTVGSCTVTNGSATVTFAGGASLPTTIVNGVPFKGPDGQYYLVNARVSATQLTLQTVYAGATASGAYTLGFRGWSSDGSDPGANITTLATAIAHAGTGSSSGGGGGSTTGSMALAGSAGRMGLAVIPQTP